MMKERESRTASWPVPGNPDPWKDQQFRLDTQDNIVHLL